MKRKVQAAGLVLLLAALGGLVADARGDGSPPAPAGAVLHERPAPDSIHATVEEILADPLYRPHRTLGQWLREHLRAWTVRDPRLRGRWTSILLWAFLAWCTVTAVAILGHIGWTLFTVLRRAKAAATHRPVPPGMQEHLHLPADTLRAMAGQAAARGDYPAAIHWTMLALLRSLADRGFVKLHPSKTNGDYVREFSQATAGGPRMAEFVADFDRYTYGGGGCGPAEFANMHNSFEQLTRHGGAQAQL
jgi:hypothetical protein